LFIHLKLSYETLQYSLTDPVWKCNLEIVRQNLDRHTPLVNEFIQALNQFNPQQQYESWCKEFFQYLTNDFHRGDLKNWKISFFLILLILTKLMKNIQ